MDTIPCGLIEESLMEDNRVLEQLLEDEKILNRSFLNRIQSGEKKIEPEMRKILSTWMLDVSIFKNISPFVLFLISFIVCLFKNLNLFFL